jgi:hypothetical protein
VKRLAVSVHYIYMADELVLVASAMGLLAAGIGWMESRAPRTRAALATLLCLCGMATIAIAAARSESRWGLRLAILGTYSGAGGVLGSAIGVMLAKRRAGAILATIGMVVPAGSKILWAGVISIGIVSVVMQIIDLQRTTPLLMPIGQAWLFATFGQNSMGAGGAGHHRGEIVRSVAAGIGLRMAGFEYARDRDQAGFRGPRRLTVPVAPEAREKAAAILASKAPGH